MATVTHAVKLTKLTNLVTLQVLHNGNKMFHGKRFLFELFATFCGQEFAISKLSGAANGWFWSSSNKRSKRIGGISPKKGRKQKGHFNAIVTIFLRNWRPPFLAQWIRLSFPSCGPEFESQAQHVSFFQFVITFWCEKDENKEVEAGIGKY